MLRTMGSFFSPAYSQWASVSQKSHISLMQSPVPAPLSHILHASSPSCKVIINMNNYCIMIKYTGGWPTRGSGARRI